VSAVRWLSYLDPDRIRRCGVLVGGLVYGLEPGRTLTDIIAAGPAAAADTAAGLLAGPAQVSEIEAVRVELPFEPRSIRDCAGFIQHLRNVAASTGRVIDRRYTDFPPFYFSNPAAAVGPYDQVRMAPNTQRFDFELEIGAVIGTGGADIAVADAEAHIFGYTIFCDWSARDLQLNERDLFGPVKGKDSANGLGPFVVTPDELEPFRSNRSYRLDMRAYVNDELVGQGLWDTVDWGFPDMIAYASRGTRLRPGDLIGSGTVPTGCLFEHFALDPANFRGWLAPGDVVRLEVEQLGATRSTILAAHAAQPLSTGY
jgi:2-keto-4-pentenoate hydratase/2-oxohepta-3-ene-1,7-dioic acid hydratase in catechol pathway